ncbi:nucleoside deaminase [Sediminitomix flava]|uniref:tRNA-specific adenosine deaminase n=1 Tax=Sediminitomix flava TaxID=379075 RepID=A0A315Z6E0_SEDFL|nr:nucleoside deaminase [Sediminitomix flava]PWJ39224.1 tRNA(adenine34) deaminase [Sediminitomix flava]
MELYSHEYFMNQALKEAQKAYEEDEIPVGAVVVCQNKIIGRGHNQTEKLGDPTAHAEMIAITSATQYLGNRYLDQCTLYVTLEPCVMCGGGLYWSQIGGIVYGAPDLKRGYSTVSDKIIHPKTQVISGIKAEECEELIRSFFKKLRKK